MQEANRVYYLCVCRGKWTLEVEFANGQPQHGFIKVSSNHRDIASSGPARRVLRNLKYMNEWEVGKSAVLLKFGLIRAWIPSSYFLIAGLELYIIIIMIVLLAIHFARYSYYDIATHKIQFLKASY
jgi:hypothetical protein